MKSILYFLTCLKSTLTQPDVPSFARTKTFPLWVSILIDYTHVALLGVGLAICIKLILVIGRTIYYYM